MWPNKNTVAIWELYLKVIFSERKEHLYLCIFLQWEFTCSGTVFSTLLLSPRKKPWNPNLKELLRAQPCVSREETARLEIPRLRETILFIRKTPKGRRLYHYGGRGIDRSFMLKAECLFVSWKETLEWEWREGVQEDRVVWTKAERQERAWGSEAVGLKRTYNNMEWQPWRQTIHKYMFKSSNLFCAAWTYVARETWQREKRQKAREAGKIGIPGACRAR